MISSNDMSYEITLIQNYPCFVTDKTDNKAEMILGTVTLSTKSKLTRLVLKNENDRYITSKNYNDTYTQCDISKPIFYNYWLCHIKRIFLISNH